MFGVRNDFNIFFNKINIFIISEINVFVIDLVLGEKVFDLEGVSVSYVLGDI